MEAEIIVNWFSMKYNGRVVSVGATASQLNQFALHWFKDTLTTLKDLPEKELKEVLSIYFKDVQISG